MLRENLKIMNEPTKTTRELIASSEVETLGVKAVSKSLGVSRATILRWIRAQKIDGFFQIGSKWLIRKVDFDDFINRKINSAQ